MRGALPKMIVRSDDITLQRQREQQGQQQAAGHGARPRPRASGAHHRCGARTARLCCDVESARHDGTLIPILGNVTTYLVASRHAQILSRRCGLDIVRTGAIRERMGRVDLRPLDLSGSRHRNRTAALAYPCFDRSRGAYCAVAASAIPTNPDKMARNPTDKFPSNDGFPFSEAGRIVAARSWRFG